MFVWRLLDLVMDGKVGCLVLSTNENHCLDGL